MAKKYRTGPGGLDRNLDPSEVDDNFRDSDAREQAALDGLATKQDSLGFTPESIANKVIDLLTADHVKYPSALAVKTYIDNLVSGVISDCGNYDASTNVFPSTGGTGTAGAIRKGNFWYVSVAGTLGGKAVTVGDSIRALVDNPGQTSTNWGQLEGNIGFVPENTANKATNFNTLNNTLFPTIQAVANYVAAQYGETNITTIGNIDNLTVNSNLVRFTGVGAVNLRGVVAGSKFLVVRNETGQDLNLVNESTGSTAQNRISVAGAGDVLIGNNCTVALVYSGALARWVTAFWFNRGYEPHLKGATVRVVTANPEGTTDAEDTVEAFIWNLTTTSALTKANLNSLYPSAVRGQSIICPNITGGGIIYQKYDDVSNSWISLPATIVA